MAVESLRVNDIVIVIVLTICLYTDLKERKIHNKIVFPAMITGLIYFLFTHGLEGLFFSLKGLGLGIALLFIPFLLGGFGAGDVKLLGAIGALKGPMFIFKTFIFTGLSGGVIAIGFLVYQRRFLTTLKRVVSSFYMLITSRLTINTLNNLEKIEYHEAFPYGIAIAAGTAAAYLVR